MEDFNNAQDATLNTVEESPKKPRKYRITLMREGFAKKMPPQRLDRGQEDVCDK